MFGDKRAEVIAEVERWVGLRVGSSRAIVPARRTP